MEDEVLQPSLNGLLAAVVTATMTISSSPTAQISEIIDSSGDGLGNILATPKAIAADGSGNVFVAGGSHNVFKVTPAGAITEVLDVGSSFQYPGAIVTDATGSAYATGRWSDTAYRIPPTGGPSRLIDSSGDGLGNPLDEPFGIAVDGAGNTFVSGHQSNNVFKISSTGVISEIIDVTGDGLGASLVFPAGVATDSAGNVFVAGTRTDNVFRITPAGLVTEIINSLGDGLGNGLNHPEEIAVSPAGIVYVTGRVSDNVFRIAQDGSIAQVMDAAGAGAGAPLDEPSGVAADRVGNVYVTGALSNNAFRVSPAGTITEIINTSGDGAGKALVYPECVATGVGNVYVGGATTNNAFEISPCLAGVASSQVVRLGSPANPYAFLPDVTAGPVIGTTWNPTIDHTSFMPLSILDLLALAPLPAGISSPYGTVLCDTTGPLFMYRSPFPGTPFALPVPSDCTIAGATLCAQGLSVDLSPSIQLTNALDITIGTY